jgi:hypothetical protein
MLLDFNCHTQDRNDIKAFIEDCAKKVISADETKNKVVASGVDLKRWGEFVKVSFNITHWPLVNAGRGVP